MSCSGSKGVWTAVATPFLSDGQIDWTSFERLIKTQLEAGIKGVVISGTTGESPTLSVQEKLSLVRKAKVIAEGKMQLMVGTGGQSTQQSLELSRLAVEAGASSLLIVTPPYNKPNFSGLKKHYTMIADQVDVPLCLYHVPSRTAHSLSAEQLREIAAHKNITMIKEASGDLGLFSDAQQSTEAVFLSGDDFTFLPSLAIGGSGCISVISNLFPKAMVAMYHKALDGKYPEALQIHTALYPLMKMLFCETNPCPLKYAMSQLNLCQGYLRLPLAEITQSNQVKMSQVLKETEKKLNELNI